MVTKITKANGEVLEVIDGTYVIGAGEGCFEPPLLGEVLEGGFIKPPQGDEKMACDQLHFFTLTKTFISFYPDNGMEYAQTPYKYYEIENFENNLGNYVGDQHPFGDQYWCFTGENALFLLENGANYPVYEVELLEEVDLFVDVLKWSSYNHENGNEYSYTRENTYASGLIFDPMNNKHYFLSARLEYIDGEMKLVGYYAMPLPTTMMT
ncbi:MAG: hypothetical protein C6I01_01895 [Epsilonproteobacteria bacterium]|nr:hypothetical protein [Campylobacterota bacterium]